ncbi:MULTISPECIES: TIGR03619 family F420-dependent LLM class oxidoreductase [unclassified Mycolicibacterium]|uniref:TIGR03619 family F420-dependent LLM class oxidoreductase n=1 Tax=unclassified Mycolicibacterium TaxID=2636767 RepID=UPI001F4C1823|nr:TIGR03619 family F420-dependent LLM class oxidoreductase [Mycolicibacterium sp. YH-1]UNB50364.1 TIGR03619 family F420-dependent LLM class oxidoreductase [Mycolicibacterium sp. YH-1]
MQFWSGTAFLNTADALAVTRMLDETGYDGMICADHLIYPRDLKSPYPTGADKPPWQPETAWPDSWVMIGAMAALTSQLRFTNAVYVAPSRPLLQVAKQVATAAVISQGRVALAVGAGWMREEFDLLGQSFDDRGQRLSEMIPALRALWQGGWVSWQGEHYQVPEIMLEPHPPSTVPIMCGGESEAALRRAARLCDGWVGAAYTWDDAVRHVERVHALRREYGRDNEPFEIMLALMEIPTADLFMRAEDIGVTAVMCAPWMGAPETVDGDVESFRASIERFAEDVIAKVR